MSKAKQNAGARANPDKKPEAKQTHAPRMVASNAIQNTTNSTENSPISSAPTALPAGAPPLPLTAQQTIDRNHQDLPGSSDEEMDDAESSDYQQSSEGPSDSESGDEEYQPSGTTSKNRKQVKYGPSHNAGRPVTGTSRQKTSNQKKSSEKNSSQKISNQNAVNQNSAGQNAITQNPASQNNANRNIASQSSASQNDNQDDEDEILLSRDHPQEERCLPYRTTSRMSKRQIISWDANLYTLSLLSLIWILEVKDYPIPWRELAAIVNPGATGEAFKQAMVKLRTRRVAEGQRVPPARPGNNHPRHECHMELMEIMRNAGVPTGPFVAAHGLQGLEVDEDPSIAERGADSPVDEASSVSGRGAGAEKANSEVGVQRSNRNSSRTTTQQSQRVTQSEPRAAHQEDPALRAIHRRSFTSAHQESRATRTKSPKPSLIFIADIGAQKALLNFNKKEQKLISDVAHNLIDGHFAQPPPNPVFFLDGITALSHTHGNTPSPYNSEDSDPEYHIAYMKRQQKRKRNGASSSPKLTGVVATADSDIRTNHKKVKRGTDENSPSYWRGNEVDGSKKRKHDDADMGCLSPGTADDWMFNPDYAVPAGESIPLGSFVKTDTTWMYPNLQIPFQNPPTYLANPYSLHDLNLAFSASSSLYPRVHTGGSLANSTDILNTNQQLLPMNDATINMGMGTDMSTNIGIDMGTGMDMGNDVGTGMEVGIDMGTGMDTGIGMSSVGINYSEQTPFKMDWSQGFNDPFLGAPAESFDPGLDDPFMGEGPGSLDYGLGGPSMGTSSHNSKYGLGGMTSDKDKDLLSSTSQWQSPSHNIFGLSQAERRLSGLPPIRGDSAYGLNMEPQSSLDMEHHRHQNRGMLNDASVEEEQFDPNSFANEAFARMDTPKLPKSEEDDF